MKNEMKQDAQLSLIEVYEKQTDFQKMVLRYKGMRDLADNLPADSIPWASYHVQAMVEEMGEVTKADKRWKTHRNENYDRLNKLDEIADVFITTMNIAIFSGFQPEEVNDAIVSKIQQNIERLIQKNG
jgi:NTP pyrophosphatase (non-canonical NTP hydrolase)